MFSCLEQTPAQHKTCFFQPVSSTVNLKILILNRMCKFQLSWQALSFFVLGSLQLDICELRSASLVLVPMGSPSRGGDVAVYVFDMINQLSLPTPFYSVLVSISVFMALSTVFRPTNSPGNSLLSHSVLPVLFLPDWSFQLSISLWKSPSALM